MTLPNGPLERKRLHEMGDEEYAAYIEAQRLEEERERAYTYRNGWWVNAYEVFRQYGGPEEGGWWFDSGEPVASKRFNREETARVYADQLRKQFPRTDKRYSVLGGEDYQVCIEPHPARSYPTERPHYE